MVELDFLFIFYVNNKWKLMSSRYSCTPQADEIFTNCEGDPTLDGHLRTRHENKLNLASLSYEGSKLYIMNPNHPDLYYPIAGYSVEMDQNSTTRQLLQRSNDLFPASKPLVVLKLFYVTSP